MDEKRGKGVLKSKKL